MASRARGTVTTDRNHKTPTILGGTQPRGYRERKLATLCARPGCSVAPAEDSDYCPGHRDDVRERMRRTAKQRRRDRRRAGLCRAGCGRKSERDLCPECSVRQGRAPRVAVNNAVNNAGRFTPDYDGRVRFRGTAKKGRQTNADLDTQDLNYGIRILQRALEAIPYLTSQEVLALPKAQRDGVRRAWLAEIHRGARHVQEPLERHRYDEDLARAAPAPRGKGEGGR
jgi:hypothetical protein